MRRFPHPTPFLFAAGIFLLAANPACGEPLHVSVTGPSPEIADQLAAVLSHDENVFVVERSQIEMLLREQAFSQAAASPETQLRAGRLLGVDAFLHVRELTQGNWQMEVVQGTSGKLLASVTSPAGQTGIDAARALLGKVEVPRHEGEGTRIAVIDFSVHGGQENAAARGTGSLLAAQLRTRLSENGLTVLNRTSTAQVSNEQALAESGQLQVRGNPLSLLGADLMVTGEWHPGEKVLRLTALDTRKGNVAADETFPIGEPAVLSDPMLKWVASHTVGTAVAEKYSWTPSIEADALIPFYQGITLFQQGKPIEATEEFEKAYRLNDKFDEAYLWEARCYEAAGLKPIAEAERRFVEGSTVGWGVSSIAANSSTDGITFLGVATQGNDAAAGRKLEVLVTDAMAHASRRILLPPNIAILRDEYDVLVGTKNSRGVTWDHAPGFLTRLTLSGSLTGSAGHKVLQLRLDDTVRGSRLAATDVPIDGDPATWNQHITGAARALLAASATADTAQETPVVELPSAKAIEDGSNRYGNIAILQLALRDPAALAADFHPLQRRSPWVLPGFLNFGLREHLLSHLPADCPQRPWLELAEIGDFLPFESMGELHSARKLDAVAELERFVKSHPADLPGAVAEYMLLWETMARLPYPELEKRWEALATRFQGCEGDPTISNFQWVSGMPGHLRQLAIIAQNDPGRRPELPVTFYPHRYLPKLEAGGRVLLEEKSGWMANEWRFFQVSPEDKVHEARAALAFLGRQHNSFKVDPRWMHDYPHSHALLSYVNEALRKADADWGLPLLHPFDAPAERAAYREMVDYVFGEIRRRLPLFGKADELDEFESYTIHSFFTNLTRPGFRQTLSDAEFDRMHDMVIREVAQAEQRLGLNQLRHYDRIWLDWRKITRAVSSFTDPKNWGGDQAEIYDPAYLADLAARTLSDEKPLFSSPWQSLMQRYEYSSMADGKRSGYFLAALPKLAHDCNDSDLSNSDLEQLFRFALTLLHGGHYGEAEPLFQQIHDTPENDLNRLSRNTDLRANAAFHLGALAQHAGRTAEAGRLYKEVLAAVTDRPIKVALDGGWHGDTLDALQTLAMRQLSDLRETGAQTGASGLVRQVRVRQAGYFPGEVTYYFRVPPGGPKPGQEGCRALLLVPSANEGSAAYCLDDNVWARFADSHGLCLVVPQFVTLWSEARHPEQWSGEATLEALRRIARQYPIRQEGLLLHGYGYGAEFVHRFALLHPSLCAAVSAHSSYAWSWEEALPEGYHPPGDLRQVPFLITCGEEEDTGVWFRNPNSIRFITYARDAGVPVIWKSLPHTIHRPTPLMEQLSQSFLANCLEPAPDKGRFVGDLRTAEFYQAGDPRIVAIPAGCRQELPSRAFALLWGKEITP